MTIDNQIKDEKLQYDINIEAAKISALSSGKIGKYEYHTGEEILPSNKRHAKFTYSSLGKAFEKQTKTNEVQWKNQISAIKEHGKQIIESNEVAKNNFNTDKSGVSHETQKEIFNRLVEERAHEFADIKDKIDPNKLIYSFKTGANEQNTLEIIKCYENYWKI